MGLFVSDMLPILIHASVAARLAFRGVKSSLGRSLIIVFSIALGIGSVLMTLGIIRALNNEQKSMIEEAGGMKTIWFDMVKADNQLEKIKSARSPGLLINQIEEACSTINKIDFAIPRINDPRGNDYVSYGNVSSRVTGIATNHHYGSIYVKKNLVAGRFFSEKDYKSGVDVCVLGQTHREKLWGKSGDWKGKTVFYNSKPYEVIGITGVNYKKIFLYSLTSHWRNFSNSSEPFLKCEFMCKEIDDLPFAMKDLEKFFIGKHRGVKDFEMFNALEYSAEILNEQKSARIITVVMGVLALFLAVIGIVNVFLAILNEKIREIGIYKALGSSNASVLLHFFFESLLLSILGGIVGIIAGIFLVKLPFLPWEGVLVTSDFVIALMTAVVAGVISGTIPSIIAARCSPAKAISRY